LQPEQRGDALGDEVGAVPGQDLQLSEEPVCGLQDGDVRPHPHRVRDDNGVPGVGLVLPGECRGHVERDGARHVADLGLAPPQQGQQQRGQAGGDVDRPAHRPPHRAYLGDDHEDVPFVVVDLTGEHQPAVAFDCRDMVVCLADVHAYPQFRH